MAHPDPRAGRPGSPDRARLVRHQHDEVALPAVGPRQACELPFTTDWYNRDSEHEGKVIREPVWAVEPNSMITHPAPDDTISTDDVEVKGWAWSNNGIGGVALSADGGATWQEAEVRPRREFEWQQFAATLPLPRTPGPMSIVARARDADGSIQPLSGTRNTAHSVQINRLLPGPRTADTGT